MKKHSAFTLIELLIVVAIIAILAAIAVPNFLEAQVRSKVSRARSDIRTVVTGLESYAVDWNKYPADLVLPILVRPDGEFGTAEGFVPPALSTPVSYLSNSLLDDPFVTQGGIGVVFNEPEYGTLFYQNVTTSREAALDGNVAPYLGQKYTARVRSEKQRIGWGINFSWETVYGAWKVGSLGPDGFYWGGSNIYDPTNGTISIGDIYRTQKAVEGGGF